MGRTRVRFGGEGSRVQMPGAQQALSRPPLRPPGQGKWHTVPGGGLKKARGDGVGTPRKCVQITDLYVHGCLRALGFLKNFEGL